MGFYGTIPPGNDWSIPSGNLLHSYWKWTMSNWFMYHKYSWMVISIAILVLVYQRVSILMGLVGIYLYSGYLSIHIYIYIPCKSKTIKKTVLSKAYCLALLGVVHGFLEDQGHVGSFMEDQSVWEMVRSGCWRYFKDQKKIKRMNKINWMT